ncbi:hypothetical protein BJF90_16130 [Pseudonocardia sp. CNS-004]|nr:hypothetical protein BJF90_16130 [Pseudonocardia sp. CNS-004]
MTTPHRVGCLPGRPHRDPRSAIATLVATAAAASRIPRPGAHQVLVVTPPAPGVDTRDGRTLVRSMIACRKPIVSAINGVAVGGGLAIALLADISIASERALLIDGHVRLGLAAGDHAALVWPLAIGMARAKYHLLLGNRITGREAAEIGLVGQCVPHQDLMSTANEIATRLAKGPQFALQGTKAALNDWYLHNMGIFEHSLYVEAHSATLPDARPGSVRCARAPNPCSPGPSTRTGTNRPIMARHGSDQGRMVAVGDHLTTIPP